MYDFDREIPRALTNDVKWRKEGINAYLDIPIRDDMIPMWLADTDFACPPVVVEAIKKRANQEIFGYCAPGDAFYTAVQGWLEKRFGWTVQKDWMVVTPTVVAAINIAIRAFTQPGGGVIIQQPVYDPFATLVKRTGRVIVNNALKPVDGRYEMDFDLLERQAADDQNKLLILCSPHNPVGRVWTREELARLADICNRNGVLVVADEIHADIIYSGHSHTPYPTVAPENGANTIYCMAPGKTFNVAGLKTSLVLIENPALREQYVQQCLAMSLDIKNTFGIEATAAAYSPEGEAWMRELLVYLEGNRDFLLDYVQKELPGAKMVCPEGTFLCWLDLSETGLSDLDIQKRVIVEQGVIAVPGPWFGPGGKGHLRLNIGCTRKNLTIAMERIRQAIHK